MISPRVRLRIFVVEYNQANSITNGRGNTTTYTYETTHGVLLSVVASPPTSGAFQPTTTYSNQQPCAWYLNSGGSIVQASASVDLLTQASSCATKASCTGTSDQVVRTIANGASGIADTLGPT